MISSSHYKHRIAEHPGQTSTFLNAETMRKPCHAPTVTLMDFKRQTGQYKFLAKLPNSIAIFVALESAKMVCPNASAKKLPAQIVARKP